MVGIEPRRWQREALAIWSENLKGVVAAVTGAGKTVFASVCATEFLSRFPQGRILVIVPTSALADQWASSYPDDLGIPAEQTSVLGGGRKSWEGAKIIVAVINTARAFSVAISSERPTMLVVDECHRAGSEKNALALRGTWVATLGLSATPERQYDQGFEDLVVPVLGPVIYTYGYREASIDGVIVPFDLSNIEFSLLASEKAEYEKLTKQIARVRHAVTSGNADDDRLEALLRKRAGVSTNSPARIPIAAKLAMNHRNDRVIVFHESVAAAEKIARILEERHMLVTSYHSQMDPRVRRENLRLYKKGAFTCLVCCRALDEGLDVPETNVGIVAGSSASSRQRVQRLGRTLRKREGKPSALVYTLHATPEEKHRLEQEARDLEGVASVRWMEAKLPNG